MCFGSLCICGFGTAKGGTMKFISAIVAAIGALFAPGAAQAAVLKVVNVNAPAINCVFDASCTVVANDSVGNLTFTPLGAGARLQSRTFAAKPGTPAAGKTAYLYRVDLTNGAGFTECTAGMVINFGPVASLPYAQPGTSEVFVITTGGLGSVGLKSAEQNGNVITFTFSDYLCAGKTSFFFGLAAATAPVATTATLFGPGHPPFVAVGARAPQH
jgi:hypothetical protein